MNKGLKIALVIGAAIAAFFLLRKKSEASIGGSPTGIQKITGTVAGIVATAGKATKTLGEAVGLFGGGAAVVAGGPVAAASIGTTTLVGTNVGISSASTVAASAPIQGAAAGTGGFGATAATVGGFAAAAFVIVSFFKTLFGNAGTPDFQGVQLKTPVQEDGEKIMEGLESVRTVRGAIG